ncbi:MAG: hypothetical protein J1D88_05690 [Treponema sp.]|nr:hypothetical protein [Treponema sp.]
MSDGPNQIDGIPEEEADALVFHYQRGSFRSRENERARNLATGTNQPRGGLFRSLVATRGNRLMLMVMLMTVVVVASVTLFGRSSSEHTVDGVYCLLDSFSYDDTVYATLSLSLPASGSASPGGYFGLFRAAPGAHAEETREAPAVEPRQISVQFVAFDSDGGQSFREEQDTVFDGGKTALRMTCPDYDIVRVEAVVNGPSGSVTLSSAVTRH